MNDWNILLLDKILHQHQLKNNNYMSFCPNGWQDFAHHFVGAAIFIAKYWGVILYASQGNWGFECFLGTIKDNLTCCLHTYRKKTVVGGDFNLVLETFPLEMV